jgi:hypothetical protein
MIKPRIPIVVPRRSNAPQVNAVPIAAALGSVLLLAKQTAQPRYLPVLLRSCPALIFFLNHLRYGMSINPKIRDNAPQLIIPSIPWVVALIVQKKNPRQKDAAMIMKNM